MKKTEFVFYKLPIIITLFVIFTIWCYFDFSFSFKLMKAQVKYDWYECFYAPYGNDEILIKISPTYHFYDIDEKNKILYSDAIYVSSYHIVRIDKNKKEKVFYTVKEYDRKSTTLDDFKDYKELNNEYH